MRSLGEFVGHIWWGIRADVTNPPAHRREVERETRERRVNDRITLRETIVREIIVEDRPDEAR